MQAPGVVSIAMPSSDFMSRVVGQRNSTRPPSLPPALLLRGQREAWSHVIGPSISIL